MAHIQDPRDGKMGWGSTEIARSLEANWPVNLAYLVKLPANEKPCL